MEKDKKVVLELNIDREGTPAFLTPAVADRVIRDAKEEFVSKAPELDCWDPSLKITGQSTGFPLLVISGPGDRVDQFSDHIVGAMPGLVRRVARDLMISGA
jgi:hypothetical protein